MSTLILAIGRFNPCHKGHKILFDFIKNRSNELSCDYEIWVTKTFDKKTNFLNIDRKRYYLSKIFPDTDFCYFNDDIGTIVDVLQHKTGCYTNIIIVSGSDRLDSFRGFITKYNGDVYNFESIEFETCAIRNEENAFSSTRVRSSVRNDDYELFKSYLPTDDEYISQKLFDELRGLIENDQH